MSRSLCLERKIYEIFTKIGMICWSGKERNKIKSFVKYMWKWLKNGKTSIKSTKLDVRSAYLNPEALRYSADFVSTVFLF